MKTEKNTKLPKFLVSQDFRKLSHEKKTHNFFENSI